MDRSTATTAADLIRSLPVQDLEDILRTRGEERFARRIARAIKNRLAQEPCLSTVELADTVARAVPARLHPENIHPATRTFQALRITVNDELSAIGEGLDQAVSLLVQGGRLIAISFHSLEDRIVKNRFRAWEKGCTCPPAMPVCACGGQRCLRSITRRPLRPTAAEVADNPRARSARLRVGEKVS